MDGHLIDRHVVIVGGVFAGLFAAEGRITISLRDVFGRQADVDRAAAEVVGFNLDACDMRAVRPSGGGIHLPHDDLIGAAGVHQSYLGHDEFAPHARGMQTLTDALVIRRRRSTRGEVLDSTMVPPARVLPERPDRLGLG